MAEMPPSWAEWSEAHRDSYWHYFLVVEWAMEWVAYALGRWAFVRILEYAGRFTILVVVVAWVAEGPQRELERENRIKEKHYRAWELIYTAAGNSGDGGRIAALQDLNEDGVSLAGAPLAGAYLVGLNLPEANLRGADLTAAVLYRARLSGAYLSGGQLNWADMRGADLTGADLRGADFTGARLHGARLAGADLSGAKLLHAEGLRSAQVFVACGDADTELSARLTLPMCP